MISRRDIFGMTAGLTSAGRLRAQNTDRPASSIKPEKVVVSVSVNDAEGRYISDLKSSDFRVLEDEGYRIIRVEIVPDVGERWTVRHRPGYRPRQ